jgi:hypothetical protein
MGWRRASVCCGGDVDGVIELLCRFRVLPVLGAGAVVNAVRDVLYVGSCVSEEYD